MWFASVLRLEKCGSRVDMLQLTAEIIALNCSPVTTLRTMMQCFMLVAASEESKLDINRPDDAGLLMSSIMLWPDDAVQAGSGSRCCVIVALVLTHVHTCIHTYRKRERDASQRRPSVATQINSLSSGHHNAAQQCETTVSSSLLWTAASFSAWLGDRTAKLVVSALRRAFRGHRAS